MNTKENFFETHLAFLVTGIVTYGLGLIFVIIESVVSEQEIIKVLVDQFVPTTITYILGCVLVNIVDLIKSNESSHYIYNILTCILVFVYALTFGLYLIMGFNFIWFLIELIFTAGLLHLNVCCYKEKFKRRNHGISQ